MANIEGEKIKYQDIKQVLVCEKRKLDSQLILGGQYFLILKQDKNYHKKTIIKYLIWI